MNPEPPVSKPVIINIGGEGEVPGVLNANGSWLQDPNWRSSEEGKTLTELEAEGHRFDFVEMDKLPYPDNSVDIIYTNSVCIDTSSFKGPCPQSSEIWRVLKPDGVWIHDGEEKGRP